jgi:hypothetical protein
LSINKMNKIMNKIRLTLSLSLARQEKTGWAG